MAEWKYDLYSDAFRAETYETYASMRAHDPVFSQPGLDGTTPIWFVTRHDDVLAVLLDHERFVLDPSLALTPEELDMFRAGGPRPDERVSQHLLAKDGDDHRRLRRLVTKAFTPRMVEQLRPRIQEIAHELLDAVAERGEMDLVDEYAFPLPITVIAELVGIPPEDRNRFRTWSDVFVSPALTEGDQARFLAQTEQFLAYLSELFERRRSAPEADLVSALLQAEENGDSLSEEELYSMVVLLIVAGHETTVSLIGNAVVVLLTHPDALETIRRHPERIPAAVEEILRFETPVERAPTRWAATDVNLGGRTIRRGDLVIVVLGSANRDESRFERADVLDVEREDVKHVAFGRGKHFCLGAPLARLEVEIALRTLFERLPGLRLATAPGTLRRRPVPLFRSLVSLPVAWDVD
ncbi:MAG TPA: cytochrome P450 [Gaiellaceae bacterium]|nr:cytochrome P450 [Gaiellaceae bacterium]